MSVLQITTEPIEAPPHRVGQQAITDDVAVVASCIKMLPLLDAVPIGILILNETRQIVFCNTAAAALTGRRQRERIYGLRPGEALDCREYKCAGGCGTNAACQFCGAGQSVIAALEGEEEGRAADCRIAQATQGHALDVRVYASPIHINGRHFVFMCLTDISDQQRRRALEHVFFHDVRNVLGALLGNLELSADDGGTAHAAAALSAGQCLADEISSFEDLLRAESGDLCIQLQPLSLTQVCGSAADLLRQHEVASGRQIVIAKRPDITISSDARILRRILINLLKNALEATTPGGRVTMDWGTRDDKVFLRVHNDSFIPRDVQLQLFQRSFSTKGHGRGLGTYSVRLFAETCLNGQVTVASCPDEGTSFTVLLPR